MKYPVTIYQDEEGWYVVECPNSRRLRQQSPNIPITKCRDVKTTMIYTHIINCGGLAVRSRLD